MHEKWLCNQEGAKLTSNLVSALSAGTGNTVIEAVRVLIEHGVQPKHIILLSLFSTPHGEPALCLLFFSFVFAHLLCISRIIHCCSKSLE